MSQSTDRLIVPPMDHYNQELIQQLHPPDWVNPEPTGRYNLIVIGGGTAGLVTAAGAGLLGAKVALIEQHLLGGDCTNVGCVPSKAMIRSARAVADVQRASDFGVEATRSPQVDFAQVMERLRRIRAEISPHDSAQRFHSEFGVEVFFGSAAFTGRDTIAVAGKTLKFSRAAIATGSSPQTLPIEGLEETGYLTNETVFSLTERPQRLAIVGGGYIGCELAQTFQRLGSQVVLLQKGSGLLTREDADAAEIIQNQFITEGIQVILNAKVKRVANQDGEKVVFYAVNGAEHAIAVDEILIGAGRSPNVTHLNLEAADVEYDRHQGIIINDYLQTSNRRIYAVGDVCMKWKFTHAANAAARIVIQNALFAVFGIGRKKLSSLTMPWCTYTDPEVAHVGLYPREAEEQGIAIETYHAALEEVDRARIDGEMNGFVKIHLKKGTDKILGATIVARHAGEMITQITLAMTNNLGLGAIAKTIYPYPTQSEAIRQVADDRGLKQLQAFKELATTWLRYRR